MDFTKYIRFSFKLNFINNKKQFIPPIGWNKFNKSVINTTDNGIGLICGNINNLTFSPLQKY